MRDVMPAAAPDQTTTATSFRACLASVLEVSFDEIPQPTAELTTTLGLWRSWLAGRGYGLVPIAEARTFQWAGFWIAVLAEADEPHAVVLMFGTPPGVVLSPQDPSLLGRAAAELPVSQGYVVAAMDPAVRGVEMAPGGQGRVELIAVADAAEAPMRAVSMVRALPGRGLEGDRYARGAGTFTPRSGKGLGYDLTLIEAEVLDEVRLTDGSTLDYVLARRNLVTRGIDLNALVGRRFRIGDVECIGRRLCEPCSHLERLTQPGVLRALIHKGGLRADILSEGVIREGALITPVSADHA